MNSPSPSLDPTRLPTYEAARALLQHLEDVYTDRDWAHTPDVQRALKATLAWLDAEPRPAGELEAVGMGPVWAATQALVQQLAPDSNLRAGWPQDPIVLALVRLTGHPRPHSLADLRSLHLGLDQVAVASDSMALARLGRAWSAHMQTVPYQVALVNPDRSFRVLPARELGHPGGYLGAFLGAVKLSYPDHALLGVEFQAIEPRTSFPGFPLGACPVLPDRTVPVFLWLDLMAEAWARHIECHPPLGDSQGRLIADLSPMLLALKEGIAQGTLVWQPPTSQAQWEKKTGWDWSQPLNHLGQPRL